MSKERLIIESMFRIANKDGEDVDFRLNAEQASLDANLTGRDLVPKARQVGISAYVLARFTAACMMRRNVRAVVISHESEATERMLARVHYYVNEIKGPRPVIGRMSANEIVFPKMNSMFYIGTAGARAFGRGDTITHLHCSEYAYWENPKKLMGGLLQAVPKTGEIIIESTGAGMNDYYKRCMRALKGESRWRLHFFPWHLFPEYVEDVTEEQATGILNSLDSELGEVQLAESLTPGQLLWRRYKLEEMEYDLATFHREYPMTIDECFEASGSSIFTKVRYAPTDDWKQEGRHSWRLVGHPRPGATYSLGADPAGGVGKDAACIEVICIDTMEQVAEYTNNKIQPDVFAGIISEWGNLFNEAFVTVENNNHGIATLSVLDDIYPTYLIYGKSARGDDAKLLNLGYRTSPRTKPLMIGTLRKMAATDLVIHSPLLRAEMGTFIEHDTGELGAEDGAHDDTVMAIACAAMGIQRAGLYAGPRESKRPLTKVDKNNPFLLDNIIEELQKRGFGFPIGRQDGWFH